MQRANLVWSEIVVFFLLVLKITLALQRYRGKKTAMNLRWCQIILEREHKKVSKIYTAMRKVNINIHSWWDMITTEVQLSNNECCYHCGVCGCFLCFYDVHSILKGTGNWNVTEAEARGHHQEVCDLQQKDQVLPESPRVEQDSLHILSHPEIFGNQSILKNSGMSLSHAFLVISCFESLVSAYWEVNLSWEPRGQSFSIL